MRNCNRRTVWMLLKAFDAGSHNHPPKGFVDGPDIDIDARPKQSFK
jgi:hypothetical protein